MTEDDAKAVATQVVAAAACGWVLLVLFGPSWLLRLMLIAASGVIVLLGALVVDLANQKLKLLEELKEKQIVKSGDAARAQVIAGTRARMEAISSIAKIADLAQTEVTDLHRKTVARAVDISETAEQGASAPNELQDEAIRRLADVNSEAAAAIRGVAGAGSRPLK